MLDDETPRLIGDHLRTFRDALGLTQIEFADQIGMDPKRYGRIERGMVNLTLSSIASVANQVGMTTVDLVCPHHFAERLEDKSP